MALVIGRTLATTALLAMSPPLMFQGCQPATTLDPLWPQGSSVMAAPYCSR